MALQTLTDGFVAVGRGMNEDLESILLKNTELVRGVNIDVSSGLIKTRSGFRRLPLWTEVEDWEDANGDDVDAMEYFQDGLFQGASMYKFQGQDYVVVASGQMLWLINLSTHELELYGWDAEEKNIPHLNMTTPRCWFCQVDQFMVVQDGVNPPYILTGLGIRQSRGANVKGVIGIDAQSLLMGTGEDEDVVADGAVAAVSPTYSSESTRVAVKMELDDTYSKPILVHNLVVGDMCTVRFRDESTAIGEITKMDRDANPAYEIRFEENRDWTKYGMRKIDNIVGDTQYHGMITVGRLEAPEVPAGTVMAFGHGRLFVVRNDRYIVAGDILFSWEPNSVLKFTEVQLISGGGALAVPASMGEIKSMSFMQNAMTGSGIGSLMVFCENGISSFSVQTPRSQWQDTDISTVLFTGVGAVGQNAVMSINNDIMFLSLDGLRSLRHTTSTVAGSGIIFENRPLSDKIKQVWLESAQWAWEYSSMCRDGKNVLFLAKACSGIKLETVPRKINIEDVAEPREPIEEIRFKAIVSLTPVAASGLETAVVYNGIWTGYEFLQIVSGNLQGNQQPLVFARDPDGAMQLLSLSNIHGQDEDTLTECRAYTGAYDFLADIDQSSSTSLGKVMLAKSILKRFEYLDIWVSGIYGEATMTLYARPVGYPAWVECGSFTVEAITSPVTRVNAWPQYRRKQRITAPRLQCDPVTGWDLLTASEFEFCLEWTGGLQIDRALFFATLLPEEKNFACVQPQGRTLSATGFDDYEYVVGGAE